MGMVSSKSKLATEHRTATEAGFHRCWYPVALARDLAPGSVIGREFLGTRVVAYRDAAGKPVVQSAWCPHLGADLSVGQIVDGRLRCPYHHWSFDAQGACANIPTGDKIPPSARIFTYPTEEAWGLIWAFNGERADFAVPRLPGADEFDDRPRSARTRPAAVGHLGRGVQRRRFPAPAHLARPAGGVDARAARGRGGRHRVPGRKPLPPATRPHQRHQHLRPASQDGRRGHVHAVQRRADRARQLVRLFRDRRAAGLGREAARRGGDGRTAECGGRAGAEHHALPPRPADRIGPSPRDVLQVRRGLPVLRAAER